MTHETAREPDGRSDDQHTGKSYRVGVVGFGRMTAEDELGELVIRCDAEADYFVDLTRNESVDAGLVGERKHPTVAGRLGVGNAGCSKGSADDYVGVAGRSDARRGPKGHRYGTCRPLARHFREPDHVVSMSCRVYEVKILRRFY